MFTALCYGSGTSGGIILYRAGYISEGQNLNFMILGMAAFFTGAVSGSFNYLSSLVLICLSAFVTSLMIKSRPVYEALLARFLKSLPQRKADARFE
jgi:H+/Cl- antiporter ClcA